VSAYELTFPLIPRRRLVGLAFGAMHSARRGTGTDVAGSRPYLPGDDVDQIDWAASARLSAARGSDEFVVRERFADEAPRVVVVCDRRPEMELFPAALPWLCKKEAMREATEIVAESAIKARGFIGYLDFAAGEPFWRPPGSKAELYHVKERHLRWPQFEAPQDTLDRAFAFLGGLRGSMPAGTFVFVVSDFLSPPAPEVWADALERRWDLIPVVIQDPVWEQSFPPVGSVLVPVVRPGTAKLKLIRLSEDEVAARRLAHEERYAALIEDFRRLGLDPIRVSSSQPEEIHNAFLEWADERDYARGRGW
jgi:uncharacterized protein (DUF58 family)